MLRDVDLELRPGERVALVGPSGAGKSTVAALLVRLADPDRGRVSVGGIDLRDGDAAGLAAPRRLGAPAPAPARRARWPTTCGWASRDASDGRVRAALADAGAPSFVAALPEGLATRVGEGGRAPLGRRGRSASRSPGPSCATPRSCVLDEPTAALDAESGRRSSPTPSTGLGPSGPSLIVTHRPALAARADRVRPRSRHGRIVPADPRGPAGRRERRRAPWSEWRGPARSRPGEVRPLACSLARSPSAPAIGLLATSGYLITRAALGPPVLTLTVAIVAVRAFAVAPGDGPLRRATDLARRRAAGARRDPGAASSSGSRRSCPAACRACRAGDLLSRAVDDVDALQHLYVRALGPPVVAVAVIAGAAAVAGLILPAAGVALAVALAAAAAVLPPRGLGRGTPRRPAPGTVPGRADRARCWTPCAGRRRSRPAGSRTPRLARGARRRPGARRDGAP